MAKPLKPENRRNPLRVLRELMSEKGHARPITQKELSAIILVPQNTICAIEAGQRPFAGANVIEHAAGTAGALWVYPLKQWMDVTDPKRPFTYDIFVEFRRQRSGRPEDWDTRRLTAEFKLNKIFEKVDDTRWWDWYLRCAKFLEDSWIEFDIQVPPAQPFEMPDAEKKRWREVSRKMLGEIIKNSR